MSLELSNHADVDDAALVARAQAGERAAFSFLVRRHQATVYRVCYRILGDELDAEDAAQEAFLRAYRKLHTFRGQSAFRTWLLRLTVNVSLNERERRRTLHPNSTDQGTERHGAGRRPGRRLRARARLLPGADVSGPAWRGCPPGAALAAVAVLVAVAALLLGALLPPTTVAAAGERAVAYGADLTPTEREELARLFGVDPGARAETVTAQELAAALEGTGLPVSPTDRAVSSSAITCGDAAGAPGELTVRTQSITRIPAALYADALITAGVAGGEILIAAPSANPVTGETALVGVFKALGLCPGPQPTPARTRLAYEQVGRALALAGPGGDLAAAAAALRRAAQPVIAGRAPDDASIGAALDAAMAERGIRVDPAQREPTIALLRRLGALDYGPYARGYDLQQPSPGEARVAQGGPPGTPTATAVSVAPAAPTAPTPPPARSIREESMDSLHAAVAAYVPRAAGALALLIGGVVLATVAGGATSTVLRRLRFDEQAGRVGLTGLLLGANIRRSPARVVGALVFYAVLLLALLAALGPLGLDFLTGTLTQFVLFLPRLLVALLLLVLGAALAGLAAERTARLLRDAGLARVGGLRTLIRSGLLFIVAVLAAAILGIDVTLLIAVAVIGLAALALTAALAVGLGLRDLSHHIAAGRYVAEVLAEGDRISVDGVVGTVERIGHAVTTVRGANGRVYLVPNGYFLEHVVEKEEPPRGGGAVFSPSDQDQTGGAGGEAG